MSKPNLKPCPFCGGKAMEFLHKRSVVPPHEDDYVAHIVCKECGASTQCFVGSDRYVVRASRYAWQRRVKEEVEE